MISAFTAEISSFLDFVQEIYRGANVSEYDKQSYEIVHFLIELLNDSVPNLQWIRQITGIFILKQQCKHFQLSLNIKSDWPKVAYFIFTPGSKGLVFSAGVEMEWGAGGTYLNFKCEFF